MEQKQFEMQKVLNLSLALPRSAPTAQPSTVSSGRAIFPAKEMTAASTCFVAMVRSESLVGLPCGPSASPKTGSPSRFRSYFPMPLYVSPAITRRTNASADPRYLAGSFPSALWPRASPGFAAIPELSAALAAAKFPPLACPPPSTSATGDADASTYAATQPSAVLGHFALTSRQSLRSSVYAPSSSANLFLPYQSESSSERSSLPS